MEPPKWGPSVSTEIAAAPCAAYRSACAAGSSPALMVPADGERRFTSAMSATVPRPERADLKEGPAARAKAAFSELREGGTGGGDDLVENGGHLAFRGTFGNIVT